MADGNSGGLITRSYQVLFVIYAPIALVTMLLQAFGNDRIPYLFIAALVSSAVSMAIAVVMWIQFYRHRSLVREQAERELPYVIRHQFILLYLPIAFLSLGFSAYYVYDSHTQPSRAAEPVVLLLPLTNALGERLPDSAQLKFALGSLLIEQPSRTASYRLEIRDHQNRYSEELLSYVKQRARQGARYFVCGYSHTCSTLVKAVLALPGDQLPRKPVFVTTLASSMHVPLARDAAYRFFPRTREIAQALAGHANRTGARTASFIATDDEYGHSAAKEFTEAWQASGGSVVNGVFVDPLAPEAMASAAITGHFSESDTPEVIYVSTFGPATTALKALSSHSLLLLGMNYPRNLMRDLGGLGVRTDNIVVAQPAYRAEFEDFENTTALFLYATIDRLMEADELLKNGSEDSFDSAWWAASEPAYLAFERDGDDVRILVKATRYEDSIYANPPSRSATGN